MKIGDKVRFLSEKGGGRVAGFQGKNIVLVEDEENYDTCRIVEVRQQQRSSRKHRNMIPSLPTVPLPSSRYLRNVAMASICRPI